jgi:hypothetical protein
MKSTRSYDGWRNSTYGAADCSARGAERMLVMILWSLFAKLQADQILVEDLTIIIVDRLYQDRKRL